MDIHVPFTCSKIPIHLQNISTRGGGHETSSECFWLLEAPEGSAIHVADEKVLKDILLEDAKIVSASFGNPIESGDGLHGCSADVPIENEFLVEECREPAASQTAPLDVMYGGSEGQRRLGGGDNSVTKRCLTFEERQLAQEIVEKCSQILLEVTWKIEQMGEEMALLLLCDCAPPNRFRLLVEDYRRHLSTLAAMLPPSALVPPLG